MYVCIYIYIYVCVNVHEYREVLTKKGEYKYTHEPVRIMSQVPVGSQAPVT